MRQQQWFARWRREGDGKEEAEAPLGLERRGARLFGRTSNGRRRRVAGERQRNTDMPMVNDASPSAHALF
jgi:hypothetical protein